MELARTVVQMTKGRLGIAHEGRVFVRCTCITAYADISVEPNLFQTIHGIADTTKLTQEFPSVLSAHESEGFRTPYCNRAFLSFLPHFIPFRSPYGIFGPDSERNDTPKRLLPEEKALFDVQRRTPRNSENALKCTSRARGPQ